MGLLGCSWAFLLPRLSIERVCDWSRWLMAHESVVTLHHVDLETDL